MERKTTWVYDREILKRGTAQGEVASCSRFFVTTTERKARDVSSRCWLGPSINFLGLAEQVMVEWIDESAGPKSVRCSRVGVGYFCPGCKLDRDAERTDVCDRAYR